MSSDRIRHFDSITKEDVPYVGGKGANLGEMSRAGFPVPEGFVITAQSYREFVAANGITSQSDQIREKILQGTIPEALKNEILAAYRLLAAEESPSLTGARVAVRSSATAEDLPDASFAGQQETFLNVRGEEELLQKVLECYASLWGERAVVYRRTQGYDDASVALAVVVQKMVESDTAGVMFTADPVTGSRDTIRINASLGLGESVVSGSVTPDSFVLAKGGTVQSTTVGSKKTKIVYAQDGKGTVTQAVPEALQKQPCLSAEDLSSLCREGVKIEKHYGVPMDIEWGIENGKTYILQARSITTLREENAVSEDEWRKYYIPKRSTGALKGNLSFLLEKMNDVFLPYDYDIGRIINMQKSVIFEEGGIVLDMHPTIDDNGIMNLPPNTIRLTHRVVHIPGMLREALDADHCKSIMETSMAGFRKEIADMAAVDADSLDCAALGKAIEQGEDLIRRLLYTRFRYALFPQLMLNRKCSAYVKKIDPSRDGYDLLQDLDNKTAEMTRDLEAVAAVVRSDPALLSDAESGLDVHALSDKYPSFADALRDFLAKDGFKTDNNCYCLASRSYKEVPDRVLSVLKPMLKETETAPSGGIFEPLMEKIRAAYGEKKYRKIRHAVDAYRYFHVQREESQYLWEQVFYYMRRLHARLNFLLTGDDSENRSTAWLFIKELHETAARGYLNDADREKIDRRIRLHPAAVQVWEESKRSIFPQDDAVLKGTGCSAGTVTGTVCTVSGPEEFHKLRKGEILVCRLTDPEWTPLFTLAGGVVADTGGELSHAAIVAREYRIPAVLGVGIATSVLKDGDLILVDGTRGEVRKTEAHHE